VTDPLVFSRTEEPFPIPLIFDTDLPELHVTTDEFVNVLNHSKLFALREFALTYASGLSSAPLHHGSIFNVLQHSEFVYDYTVGKIGLKTDLAGRVP